MGVHFSLIAETQHRHSHRKPMKTYENIISSWIRRRSVRCSASWKPARAPTYRPSRGCRRKWRPRNEGIEWGTGPGMMESEWLKHAKTCKNNWFWFLKSYIVGGKEGVEICWNLFFTCLCQDNREEANENVRFLKTLEPYVNSLLSESIDFEAQPTHSITIFNMFQHVSTCLNAEIMIKTRSTQGTIFGPGSIGWIFRPWRRSLKTFSTCSCWFGGDVAEDKISSFKFRGKMINPGQPGSIVNDGSSSLNMFEPGGVVVTIQHNATNLKRR